MGQFDTFSHSDMVSIELDLTPGVGIARFYKNGAFSGLEFRNLLDHPSFQYEDAQKRGIRPCVSVSEVSECVALAGYKHGETELKYANDFYDRASFTCNIDYGYAQGKGWKITHACCSLFLLTKDLNRHFTLQKFA